MCDRQRIDSQHAAMVRRERINALRSLMAEGYQGSTTIASVLRDLENCAAPLNERLGRGFTA